MAPSLTAMFHDAVLGDAPMAERPPWEQVFWCNWYAGGLIGTLVVYGLLQERIYQIPYDGVYFPYSVFLVFLNRFAAVVFCTGMALWRGDPLQQQAPLWKYLVISFSNVYASTCQSEALKYVSFSVQMLGKSFKMIPVMLWGMAISRKRYGKLDWGVAILVTGGVTEFLLTGPTESNDDNGNNILGFLWLAAYLALDGLTSSMEEKLFKENGTTKYNQMMYVNGLSALVSLVTLVTTGTLFPALGFFFTKPQFMLDALVFSASAVSSQFFIYSLVKEFGALIFAATMNVRQLVSIFVSYVTYHNSITGLQILGLAIVFGALFFKSYVALRKVEAKPEVESRLAPDKGPEPTREGSDKAAGKA